MKFVFLPQIILPIFCLFLFIPLNSFAQMVFQAPEIPKSIFVKAIFEGNAIYSRDEFHYEGAISIITRGEYLGIIQDFGFNPTYGTFAIGPGYFSENFLCAIGAGLSSLTTPETENQKTNLFYFARFYYHDEWYKIFMNLNLAKQEIVYSAHLLRKLAPHFYVGPTLEHHGLHGLMLEYQPWKKFSFSFSAGCKIQYDWGDNPEFKIGVVFRT